MGNAEQGQSPREGARAFEELGEVVWLEEEARGRRQWVGPVQGTVAQQLAAADGRGGRGRVEGGGGQAWEREC